MRTLIRIDPRPGPIPKIKKDRSVLRSQTINKVMFESLLVRKMKVGYANITIRSGGVYAARRKILERSLLPRKNFSFHTKFLAVSR